MSSVSLMDSATVVLEEYFEGSLLNLYQQKW